MHLKYLLLLVTLGLFVACGSESTEPAQPTPTPPAPQPVQIEVPELNEDSIFQFVADQVAFGPRVPGTPEHDACRQYLVNQLGKWVGSKNVIEQKGRGRLFNGKVTDFTNIIAAINPQAKQRILLMAHWDTRLYADHDDDASRRKEAILGANDGASGVAVLLEIARQLHLNPIDNLGIDIILFDAEDQGKPDNMGYVASAEEAMKSWCLGSQHWSKNRHRSDASYRFGILLDMVGAPDAVFPKEGYSRQFAPRLVERIWTKASQLGYGRYFIPQNGGPITDDHYFVNTIANIPTVDIIHYDPNTGRFDETWHTHDDDLDAIDPRVMQAVGEVVLHIVMEEDAVLKGT